MSAPDGDHPRQGLEADVVHRAVAAEDPQPPVRVAGLVPAGADAHGVRRRVLEQRVRPRARGTGCTGRCCRRRCCSRSRRRSPSTPGRGPGAWPPRASGSRSPRRSRRTSRRRRRSRWRARRASGRPAPSRCGRLDRRRRQRPEEAHVAAVALEGALAARLGRRPCRSSGARRSRARGRPRRTRRSPCSGPGRRRSRTRPARGPASCGHLGVLLGVGEVAPGGRRVASAGSRLRRGERADRGLERRLGQGDRRGSPCPGRR